MKAKVKNIFSYAGIAVAALLAVYIIFNFVFFSGDVNTETILFVNTGVLAGAGIWFGFSRYAKSPKTSAVCNVLIFVFLVMITVAAVTMSYGMLDYIAHSDIYEPH